MGQIRPLFVYFRSFHNAKTNIAQISLPINDKASLVCLGLEPGAAEWKMQSNPRSYGGTPQQAKMLTP